MNENIYNVQLNNTLSYVIVHQVSDGQEASYLHYMQGLSSLTKFKYIQLLNQKGLSKSRNVAIRESSADYIIFSDDDNYYIKNIEDKIRQVLEELGNPDFVSFKIEDDKGNEFKKYKTTPFRHSKNSALRISSIENVVSRKFIVDNDITFNESFGLGARYPSCEQPLFLNDILDSGGRAYFYPETITFHPLINSGDDFFTSLNAITRRKLFLSLYGCMKGNIYCLIFILKKITVVPNGKKANFIKHLLGWRE